MMVIQKIQCVAVGALLACAPLAAQVQFPVSFDATANGLTVSERNAITSHIQAAGQIWVRQLDFNASRSLEVEVGINDSRPTANAGSVTSGFVAVISGRNTFEQGATAELRSGVDPNGAGADTRVTFNTNYLRNELWFDPDPLARVVTVPTNRTDAMSVALHELGHAFAYNGWGNLSTGQPPPDFWSTFDRWTTPGPPIYFDGPQAFLASATRPDQTTGNIFHWANGAAMAPAGRMAEPVIWSDGVPLPQLVNCAPRSVSANAPELRSFIGRSLVGELMNGVVFIRGGRYKISGLDRAVLRDLNLSTTIFAGGFELNF
jgi:hypothetical protein